MDKELEMDERAEIEFKAKAYVGMLFVIIGFCIVSLFKPITFTQGAVGLLGYHVILWGRFSLEKKKKA